MKALKGISFPFRVGSKGGIVMTKADLHDSTHIEESIQQIIATQVGERAMEIIGSQVSYQVYEPNEEATHTLIKYEIVDAISKYEKRVTVTMEDIEIYDEDEKIYATVNYLVLQTGLQGTTDVEIGGQAA